MIPVTNMFRRLNCNNKIEYRDVSFIVTMFGLLAFSFQPVFYLNSIIPRTNYLCSIFVYFRLHID